MLRRFSRCVVTFSRTVCCISLLLLLWVSGLSSQIASAQETAPTYLVQPGDTLTSIAARCGADVLTLQRLNGLQDPRHIYPGQTLRLPALPGGDSARAWRPYDAALGDALDALARPAGLTWEEVARGNRWLNPTRLWVGQTLYLPEAAPARAIVAASPDDTRLALALRYDLPYGAALHLNPQLLPTGALFLLPGEGVSLRLPYPVVALNVAAQPVARGQTAVLTLETAIPSTCTVTFLDVTEACYTDDSEYATSFYAFIGTPALLAPGAYDVTLRIQSADRMTDVTLPLIVAPGRYDYERLDLPADRQSLLDPALSEHERVKVASLRGVRSTERLWEFPFRSPVQGAVTSYYGSRRSYGYGFGSYHAGADFRMEIGDPVSAPASGVVILAEPLVVRGRAILIDHGWGIVSGYWHLSRIDVTVGQSVAQGEIIGAVGNTGLSTGPHLHWELWVNGVSVSPLQWVYGLTEAGLSSD